MLRRQVERLGEFGAGQFAGGLQPPQGEQFLVVRVQPAGGLGDLPALAGETEPENGQIGEVGARVGQLPALVETADGRLLLDGRPAADLVHGDRDQPGPERSRVAQPLQAVEGPDHGLLRDVVHVGVAVQRPAGDVVDQREPGRDQRLARLRVARLGRAHEGRPGPALHVNVHGSALRPAVVRPPLPPRRPLGSAQITTICADSENRRTARPPAGPVRARMVTPREERWFVGKVERSSTHGGPGRVRAGQDGEAKTWVHQGPPDPVRTPTPICLKEQLRMLARWPGLFIHDSITAAGSFWPRAMFSPQLLQR